QGGPVAAVLRMGDDPQARLTSQQRGRAIGRTVVDDEDFRASAAHLAQHAPDVFRFVVDGDGGDPAHSPSRELRAAGRPTDFSRPAAIIQAGGPKSDRLDAPKPDEIHSLPRVISAPILTSMLLLSCAELSRGFDAGPLFEDVGFELYHGERVG